MKNNDELQYMPMMRGEIRYSNEEFKTTNIRNHGQKKGTVRWNHKKFVTTLVLTGTVFAVSMGSIHAFKTMSSAPKEPIGVVQTVDISEPIEVETVKRTVADYKVKYGDTLDGIIYSYTDSASEKDYYKNYVTYYNGIENDIIRAGEVITLVGVPEDRVDEFNTGYNASIDNNDEISIQLNGAVQELVESERVNGEIVKGSLTDTIMNELDVYNATTNEKTRSYLAKTMLKQIENVREYGTPTVEANERSR